MVLISESSGKAEIGWDTRSLEDAKKLLEYGLAFINKSITNPAEKQKDSASSSFDDVWDEEGCEEIIAEGQKLTPRFKELLKEVCHAWYDRGVKLAEQKAAETPQWMIDFLNDILSSCIIYDDYVRRREYQSKVLGIIKWLENQKTKTPQWMIDFLKEIQPYSINKEEYAGYAGRIEFESKILTIIKWLEGNFIQQKEQIVYKNSKSEIDFADKYSHDVWEKLMSKFNSIEGYSIGCNDVSDIVLNAVLNAFKWQKEQKPSINIDQLKSMMLQYLQEAANEKDDSDIEADTDKWARMILRYDFEQKPAEWSEEDEKMRKSIIQVLKSFVSQADCESNSALSASYPTYYKEIDWLESRCPQLKQEQKEPSDKGEISDGYHTFNELYYYRLLYNAAFFNLLPKEWVHKSKRHHDGEECFGGGWFIVMANLPTGQISNHYEIKDWDLFHIPEKETADEWDGHTPQQAAEIT